MNQAVNQPAGGYVIVIPARMESQRLPGKVLLDIAGKPMLQHVWERATHSAAQQVVVATDDQQVVAAVQGFGGVAVLTRRDHASGSDRIAECARLCGWADEQVIVNLQGDEPQMPAACLDQVASLLAASGSSEVATLYWPIASAEQVCDPNAVKVVFAAGGQALYFSRSPLPFARDHASVETAMQAGLRWYRHLGLYAYRNRSLQAFTGLPAGALEQTERLEQLRFLEHGRPIVVAQALQAIPPGVDSPADLERVRASLGS
jgi:3-deoxy-manno-octulosonate cytidylyltransferase (CMP-KDO synthetase)